MQKKMATVTDEYKQQQELLEKLQHKGEKHNNYVHNYGSTTCVRIIICTMIQRNCAINDYSVHFYFHYMQSFEEIITSKQQLSTTEVEMKEKLADLKV